MSEALEKLGDLRRLPIFPLPLVLMPYELLPLHIFEPKYRQMLDDVQNSNGFFGITMFDPEEGFEDRPAAGSTGCVAEIREVQTLEDGRSNILTMGVARYRLLEYVDEGTPYLMAEIGVFEDDSDAGPELAARADEAFSLFERVAKAAYKLGGGRGRLPEIPRAEPEQLSFLIAAAFNLENEVKYEMLEERSTAARFERLSTILKQSVDQMEENAEIFRVAQTNGHGKKKIDV